MTNKCLYLLLILCGLLTPSVCLAANDNNDSQLLCAITEVVECNALSECLEVLPETVGLPDFIMIDLDKKLLLEATDEGPRTTKIDAVTTAEGRIAFGGLDNGRGWSAVLSDENRVLSATITDELAGFVVFGACLPKP